MSIKWEDLYEEAVEVIKCIPVLWKDGIIATIWGDDFDSSDNESDSGVIKTIALLCGVISFEEFLEWINDISIILEVDEDTQYLFFRASINHMTRSVQR